MITKSYIFRSIFSNRKQFLYFDDNLYLKSKYLNRPTDINSVTFKSFLMQNSISADKHMQKIFEKICILNALDNNKKPDIIVKKRRI